MKHLGGGPYVVNKCIAVPFIHYTSKHKQPANTLTVYFIRDHSFTYPNRDLFVLCLFQIFFLSSRDSRAGFST